MLNDKLLVIVGPTASGKTGLGIELAKKNNGVIISADSRQVYSGMNIGTAKPLEAYSETVHDVLVPDTVDSIDHYLLNIREPKEKMSLFEWQQSAFKVIDYVIAKSKQPILVGGTMLYVDSVVKNYEIPEVSENADLRADLEKRSASDLYEELLAKDPKAKDIIERGNSRRTIRALEVIEATGKLFSELRAKQEPRYEVQIIGISPEKHELDKRIELRARHMIDNGLIDEVKGLDDRYGDSLPLLQTLGYRQVLEWQGGDYNKEALVAEIARATKRYARRQMSWWRGRDEIEWTNNNGK